ncbi:MAG TPA: PQQ-binding-like beta-propeller repeat protein [Verrucomicrobiae bacterium]
MLNRLRFTGVVVGSVLTLVCLASANDWPQWRGPERDGISTETGLLKTWPADGPSLAWKATGLGLGYSGVAVSAGKIYTLGDLKDANYLFVCDEQSGKQLWSAKIGEAGAPGWGGFAGPRCTPTVDGNRVYVVGQFGDIACFDFPGRKTVWQKHLVKDFGGSRPEWGFSESPLVDGDLVLFTPGGPQGTIIALNKNTGELVWRTKEFTDNAHYSSITMATLGGVRQYVQLTDANLVGVAPEGGRILWKAPRKGQTAVITTPVCKDDLVFVTSGYGVGCNLFRVTKEGDNFKAEQVYANKNLENHHGGVVLIGDKVYGHSDSKGWVCLNLKTGDLAWNEKSKQQKGSICAADGMLYLRSEAGQGTVVLAEATPTGFVEKGRFNQPGRTEKNSWPHPVVANGKLYLRDQDALLCYDVKAR